MTKPRYAPIPHAIALCLLLAACGEQQGTPGAIPDDAASGKPAEITTQSGVTMVLVPAGEFMMGSEDGAADEAPRHKVSVSAFAIDKFEVSQEQFTAFEVPNPSHFQDPQRPVEQVRWSDAALFCNERSRRERLEPCYDEVTFACDFDADGYRLPTEAEWEYAARAGAGSDAPPRLESCAVYAGNSNRKTEPIGRKRPNAWGICDMLGNVLEWCHDVYDAAYYAESPAQDPRGPADGEKRVLRGGAWNSSADRCRASARYAELPGIADACFARDTFGFRCVRRMPSNPDAVLQPSE